VVSPNWIETARPYFGADTTGAVGGIFYGQKGFGLVGLFQRLEYVRYARQLARRRNEQVFVLTGTATMFKVQTLRDVAAARTDGRIPGCVGAEMFYDENNITEDSEITLAIKHLGYRAVSPMDCWVSTEVMPTWRQLYIQRVRWQRGAIENLRAYGLTRITWPYAARQLLSFIEFGFFFFYMAMTIYAVSTESYHTNWLWVSLSVVFVAERVISVRAAGPKAMLFAASMIAETGYGIFKHAINTKCVVDALRQTSTSWS